MTELEQGRDAEVPGVVGLEDRTIRVLDLHRRTFDPLAAEEHASADEQSVVGHVANVGARTPDLREEPGAQTVAIGVDTEGCPQVHAARELVTDRQIGESGSSLMVATDSTVDDELPPVGQRDPQPSRSSAADRALRPVDAIGCQPELDLESLIETILDDLDVILDLDHLVLERCNVLLELVESAVDHSSFPLELADTGKYAGDLR